MSYQKSATYLRVHGAKMDKEFQDPRKTNKIGKDVEDKLMSYGESRDIFITMANRNGANRAFKIFKNFSRVRESLNIIPKIRGRLSGEV